MKASVLETLKRSAAVPSMPQVVVRFLEIMQDPEFSYRDLVKVLSADPGTVSEVLRLSNSALFGVRNKVVSLQQALTLLGPKRTRSILLGRYLVDAMSNKRVDGLDMCYFWRRSLATSVIASRLAELKASSLREEAFISGLLADIGIPILAEAFTQEYAPVVAKFCPNGPTIRPEDEQAMVELTHGEVSAMVLSHWSLPDDICKGVNLHQSSHPGDGSSGTIAKLLNAADRISKALCEVSKSGCVADDCMEAMAFVDGNGVDLLHLLPTVERDIEDLAEALRIDVIPKNAYALITENLQNRLSEAAHA